MKAVRRASAADTNSGSGRCRHLSTTTRTRVFLISSTLIRYETRSRRDKSPCKANTWGWSGTGEGGRNAMCARIAQSLSLELDRVNVKAKTAEKLGPVGQGLSIEARAVALLVRAETH